MSEPYNNFDQEELEKFDALANEWWDLNGKLRTLHKINPLRTAYVSKAVSLPELKLLDVGCGGGIFSEALAQEGATVTGIDASEDAITVAREHARLSALEIDYQTITAEAHAESNAQQYDVVACMELLEHVPDPAQLLQACATLLKPGGDLFVATLNRNIKAYAFAVLGAEYLLGLLPRGTHDYSKFIRPSELDRWLRNLGFTTLDISGMHYLPLSGHCFLNNDPSVNYLLHARLA